MLTSKYAADQGDRQWQLRHCQAHEGQSDRRESGGQVPGARREGTKHFSACLLSDSTPPGVPPVWRGRAPHDVAWSQIDKNVEREIINHRMLNHQNIIGFKEVRLPVGRQSLACRSVHAILSLASAPIDSSLLL
jgi:hypothetical protein